MELEQSLRQLEGASGPQEVQSSGVGQSTSDNWVTGEELEVALARIRETIQRDTEIRLEANERSMESLRRMITETDSMLEQVLEKLEAAE